MPLKIRVKDTYRLWFEHTLIYFFLQNTVRLIFYFGQPTGVIDALDTVFDGFIWDIGTWSLISIPYLLFSLLLSEKKHQQFLNSPFKHVLTFTFSLFFSFVAFCEIIFWNEFHSRFNFIAVDYLIYTNEVLRNLQESYPMKTIIACVVAISLLLTFLASKINYLPWQRDSLLKKWSQALVLGIIFPLTFVMSIGPWMEGHDPNFRDDQMSRNGVYEFVRAFRSNKIDYQSFYPTVKDNVVNEIITSKEVEPSPAPINLNGIKPNIVMIVVESLGAKFIGPIGNDQNTTPYLNKLAKESIFFENFYATGTRTVRGLEALSLSVPPTPGYAVVKRPDHKGLYSIGNTFKNNNYNPIFLYGGRGFFDNMNSFFSGNEFHVIDQGDFEKSETTFSNAWGVCDEDLFHKAEKIIGQQDSEKPFFLFMLTTSNHRPFTYPDGKIDIPSGASRAGAVKYTDYAIGKFLDEAKDEKWFKNTIFVIVADHSTEGRGQFDLEMKDFHIPLWIYAPHLLKPQVVKKLGSQIDLLPSLIHLLGLKDNSPFYGKSLFNPNWDEERAFVGNYQYVGYYRNNVLTTLGPNRTIRNFSYDPVTKKQAMIEHSPFLNEAISYYQSASHLLDKGLYRPMRKNRR